MDDEVKRIFSKLLWLLSSQDNEILQLQASIAVLKIELPKLAGRSPEDVLHDLRESEERALAALPISQRVQELRQTTELFAKYGDALGKNRA